MVIIIYYKLRWPIDFQCDIHCILRILVRFARAQWVIDVGIGGKGSLVREGREVGWGVSLTNH